MTLIGGMWFSVLAASLVAVAANGPEQPVPFSHKAHSLDVTQQCQSCHVNPDPGKIEGIPQAAACMSCHSTVKADSQAIRQLAAYAKKHRPIRWVRIYVVPDFVIFNHRAHTAAGASCEECHGKVAESEQLSTAPDFTQKHCTDCHRAKNVSTECGFCHDLG